MSYDTRLFIVREYPEYMQDGPLVDCRTLATIDLANAGRETATGALLAQARAAGERFYQTSTEVPSDMTMFDPEGASQQVLTEDKYGARLTAVPARALLDALKADQRTDPYRRFAWAIALIASVMSTTEESETIRVLQFGY